MASRKRRPQGRIRRTPAGLAADEAARRGSPKALLTEEAMEALSFAQAAVASGIDKYRIGAVVKRAGVPVYRSPADARKKYIKREDLGRLTGLTPDPETPGAGQAGVQRAE